MNPTNIPPGAPPADPVPPALVGPGCMQLVAAALLAGAVFFAAIFGVDLKVQIAGQDVPIMPAPGKVIPPNADPGNVTPKPTPVVNPDPAKAKRSYGWKRPKTPPPAALRFNVDHLVSTDNPPSISLRASDVPVYDQGQEGSCTGNAMAALAAFYWKNSVAPASVLDIAPSRNGIYYDERALEGTTCCDDGASVEDGAKVIASIGVAPESLWPYNIAKFNVHPPLSYYTEAAKHRVPQLVSIDTTSLDEIRTALANRRPIAFGISLLQSFETVGPSGLYVPSGPFAGDHCPVMIGYDDTKRQIECRNSWGTSWGDKGYFFLPYATAVNPNVVSDGWCIPSAIVPVPPPPGPEPEPDPKPPIPPPAPKPTPPPVVDGVLYVAPYGPGDSVTVTRGGSPPSPAPKPAPTPPGVPTVHVLVDSVDVPLPGLR